MDSYSWLNNRLVQGLNLNHPSMQRQVVFGESGELEMRQNSVSEKYQWLWVSLWILIPHEDSYVEHPSRLKHQIVARQDIPQVI